MTRRAVLGVDPGVKGGLAILRADGTIASVWTLLPGDEEREVVGVVGDAVRLLRAYESEECFFEHVHYIGRRKDGRKGDGGKGAFTFGCINGLLRGALLAYGVRPRMVTSQTWQTALECLSGGSKNVTKLRAQQLFPGEQVTHGSADALLIAEYGRRRLRDSGS